MKPAVNRERVLILGAAGRDFHNFNMVFREDAARDVVAFTAQQIPHIADRRYPASLAGPLYPDGIPIHPEDQLEALIARHGVDLARIVAIALPYTRISYRLRVTEGSFDQALAPILERFRTASGAALAVATSV